MSAVEFRLARPEEKQRVLDFVNANFDWRLPLVNRPEWFRFYYESGDGLQFAVAEENGEWLAAAGYIRANRSPAPDIWVSVWVARKSHNGVGLELMDALPRLTGARVVACNNIRPKTMAFYRFLGWEADRVGHFFRLADRAEYRLAVPGPNAGRLPAAGDLTLEPVHSVTRLQGMGMPPSSHTPVKDIWYMTRRYFDFDHYRYDVWCATERGKLLAYLVTRTAEVTLSDGSQVKVLRMVDFIGEDAVLARLGTALDRMLAESGAEYLDCYCAGIPAETMAAAGLSQRQEGDGTVIPNYLDPPVQENTEYYYFTNRPEGFVLFRADGDQDRPNLPAD